MRVHQERRGGEQDGERSTDVQRPGGGTIRPIAPQIQQFVDHHHGHDHRQGKEPDARRTARVLVVEVQQAEQSRNDDGR